MNYAWSKWIKIDKIHHFTMNDIDVLWCLFCVWNCHESTHLPQVPPLSVTEIGHHWFRWRLVACSASSHYQDQWWLLIDHTRENRFRWKIDQNQPIFIDKNALQLIVSFITFSSRKRRVKRFIILFVIFIWNEYFEQATLKLLKTTVIIIET